MGSGYTVIGSQQILPALAVVVAIGNCADSGSYRAGGIGILLFREDISTRIIRVYPRLSCRLIILSRQLVQTIIGVAGGIRPVRDRQNISPYIISIAVGYIVVKGLVSP